MKDKTVQTVSEIEKILSKRKPGAVGRFQQFAVLIPMVETERGIEILFEQRSAGLHRQPGEFCFPGGQQEPGETPLMCALRETCEELSIDRTHIGTVTKVQTLYTRGFLISCYAAKVDIDEMEPSSDEVTEVFTVPLTYFMNNRPEVLYMEYGPKDDTDFPYEKIGMEKGKTYNWHQDIHEIPIYTYQNHIIWGMTGRMMQGFVAILKEAEV